MCVIDDGEYATIWNETEHTSRKERKCACCNTTIAIGERYLSHFDVFDGDATSEAMCIPCTKDRERFSKAHAGHSTNPGNFQSMLKSCIEDNAFYGPEPPENRRWKQMLKRIANRSSRRS